MKCTLLVSCLTFGVHFMRTKNKILRKNTKSQTNLHRPSETPINKGLRDVHV